MGDYTIFVNQLLPHFILSLDFIAKKHLLSCVDMFSCQLSPALNSLCSLGSVVEEEQLVVGGQSPQIGGHHGLSSITDLTELHHGLQT